MNWEDMLNDDVEIEIKKEGENFDDEVVEEIKEKPIEPKKPVENINNNQKKQVVKKKKKGKKVVLDEEAPAEEDVELSHNEKEKLEKEIMKNQEKEIASMFGLKIENDKEITLNNESDYENYGKKIAENFQHCTNSKNIALFIKTLLYEVDPQLKKEDLSEITKTINELSKSKTQAEKLAKSKAKPVTLKVDDRNMGLYDDYQMDNEVAEDYDYQGRDDDYDFM